MALTFRSDPQENTAVKGPVNLRLKNQFEISEFLQRRQESSLFWWILNANDCVILDKPFTRDTMTGQILVPFPASQVFAIE